MKCNYISIPSIMFLANQSSYSLVLFWLLWHVFWSFLCYCLRMTPLSGTWLSQCYSDHYLLHKNSLPECLLFYTSMNINLIDQKLCTLISFCVRMCKCHLSVSRCDGDHCSGSLEPETLWSRSEALHEYGVIHGGWHFNIHQDLDTRGR